MGILDVVILSIVQGLTEFLPVSSSGHLVLAQIVLGLGEVPVLFDLILHLGTACATVIVYHQLIGAVLRDLGLWLAGPGEERRTVYGRGNVKLALYILLSTAVTGVLGVLFRESVKGLFTRPLLVSVLLACTGFMLLATKFIPRKEKGIGDIGPGTPLLIGGAQAVAMMPGISRSGATISTGLFLGMERSFAGSYSFLLSIPSILGASILEFLTSGDALKGLTSEQRPNMVVILSITGFIVSLLTGYVALKVLISFLSRGKLYIFSFYCLAIAVASATLMLFYR
jgi:undecaprenyl-diphosphatase